VFNLILGENDKLPSSREIDTFNADVSSMGVVSLPEIASTDDVFGFLPSQTTPRSEGEKH
jgi:hypothetical protein